MKRVRVAAGVLQQSDGQILLAQRPSGKIAAGRWEFPGGKIESEESAEHALKRELREEIGVEVRQARPLLKLTHAYTERIVELDTWLVTDWQGSPVGLEQQALAWCRPARADEYDLLEADKPILDALQLPVELPITGAFASLEELLSKAALVFSAGHRLLRFRAPHLDDEAYGRHLPALLQLAAERAAGVLVDRLSCLQQAEGLAGLHLRATDLAHHSVRPCAQTHCLLASVHSVEDIHQAQALGANALVLGHVQPTPTHPGQPHLGWQGFESLTAVANVPVYGIGGLGAQDLSRVWQSGGQGVAGIRSYW